MEAAAAYMDVEQEQETLLLNSTSSQRSSGRRWVLPTIVGLAIVCAIGFVGRPSRKVTLRGVGGPRGLIQAYALEKGRALSEDDMQAIFTRASARPKTKKLLARFLKSNDTKTANPLEGDLSEECGNALEEKLEKFFDGFGEQLVDMFFTCILSGEDSEECEKEDKDLENFFEDFLGECIASGDFCNISAIDGDEEPWLQPVCVPTECHKEVEETLEFLKEQLKEEIEEAEESEEGDEEAGLEGADDFEDCEDCEINITCGVGGKGKKGGLKEGPRDAAIFMMNMEHPGKGVGKA